MLVVPMANAAGESAPQRDGRFHNQARLPQDGVMKKLRIGLKYLFLRKPPDTRPSTPLHVQPMTRQQVLDAPDHSLTATCQSRRVLPDVRIDCWLNRSPDRAEPLI